MSSTGTTGFPAACWFSRLSFASSRHFCGMSHRGTSSKGPSVLYTLDLPERRRLPDGERDILCAPRKKRHHHVSRATASAAPFGQQTDGLAADPFLGRLSQVVQHVSKPGDTPVTKIHRLSQALFQALSGCLP